MAAVTIYNDFEAPQNKFCHHFPCLPIYLPWSDETGCDDLHLLMLNFKPDFSHSSLPFIKRFFSSSSLSSIRVIASVYLRLLIFLLEILVLACASPSLVFHKMYSGCKLNKQGDNIHTALMYSFPNLEPVHCSMSGSNCCFLNSIQVSQEAAEVVWYSHLFKNFPVCFNPHSQRL